MTNEWPAPAWLDCHGEDANDGKVRCTIRVREGLTRELFVPAESFDAQGQRLKVRIVRPSEPLEAEDSLYCPSQELEAMAFVIDCPGLDESTRARFDVLAGFLNSRTE